MAALTGDWKELKALLKDAKKNLNDAVKAALIGTGEHYAGRMRQKVSEGPFTGLSALTIAARGLKKKKPGTKPLVATGAMRNSIGSRVRGLTVEISVPRTTASGVKLAPIHEFGTTIVIKMTAKMRRFLFGVLFKKAGGSGGGGGGGGKMPGYVVINIPARPFIRPVFEEMQANEPKLFLERLKALLPEFT